MLYDMFEICLLLLILLVLIWLALGRVGLSSGGWSHRCSFAADMFVHFYWCHGAVFRWLPLHWSKVHWSKASPLVPVRAEGGELFVDQRYLWAQCLWTKCSLIRYLLVPRSPSLSWQSFR